MTSSQQDLVVCTQCDAVHRWRPLSSREVARCSRCSAVLGRGHRIGMQAMIALTLAALFVLLIANLTSMVSIRLGGTRSEATLASGILATWRQGEHLVAIAAGATSIVAPAMLIALRLALLLPLATGHVPRYFGPCMRLLHQVSQWNMVEVLMVAAAVSIARIAAMAPATPGPGMFAFGALALLLAAIESAGLRHLWLEHA